MNNTKFRREGNKYIVSQEDINFFHENGYVVFHDVINEEELKKIDKIYEIFLKGEVKNMGRDFVT
ncbi:hypothetical protein fh0823_17730 [Francisella halioticida]|uniref:Phytanoyl-CoA dioxygenase n=1 Tax=Francisella halioticida TaxID=549298 RepID=A0ABN5AXQ9_9GAMM|nr:hypothetical protein [Francisella halioticida]ASG68689.1 hypothetical protein CDV26_10105 [Francisella halioticida]BCD91634.1 hypothetical protein fh0823_17730 [Francisella halioticida]